MNRINAQLNADMFLNKAFAVLIGFVLLFAFIDEPYALLYSIIGAPFAALILFPLTIPLSILCSFIFKNLFKGSYKTLTKLFFITRS
ncbi:hypothetical protein CCAL13119_08950 [Campylobacter sp. RM13119]|uniref:hypothetical protein n=1 Tax=Campylobacter californiensis TaxID=1032243 RepID=UPI0014754924|nr:hypothetical protein [Campylobacter sp. RM13119]MBE3607050.1 hypothetical protein [Campylobacter sp. RM13119]